MSCSVFNLVACLYILISNSVFGSCYEIRSITSPGNGLLESPQWSVQENALYWVNTFGQSLFRMDGDTGEITSMKICHGPAFLIVPVRDFPGYVIVAIRASIYLVKWGASGRDLAYRLLTTVDLGKPDHNIDDGKADAAGRLWFGTFGLLDLQSPNLVPIDRATLYSIDANNFVLPAIKKRPVSLSNGIAWSHDNTKMYYNDSPTRRVAAFDFDLNKGAICNESVIFRFEDHNIPGYPDGMTIDADGNLWVATFNTRILHINPKTGELIKQIELPVNQVSSMMWGGPNLDTLFVTTGLVNVTDQIEPLELSGALIMLTDLGTRGVPENQFVFPNAPNY